MEENKLINEEEEMFDINCKMIFEYSKMVDKLSLENIKVLKFKDGEKTICFLFYESDFFAFNRVNFKNGYEFNSQKDVIEISENLNNRIRKIPNVARTRDVLKIDDIEARIYDMREYILVLTKENMKVFKVEENGDLSNIDFEFVGLDISRVENKLGEYSPKFAKKLNRNHSGKSIFSFIKDSIIQQLKLIRDKIFNIRNVKFLQEGKDSIVNK